MVRWDRKLITLRLMIVIEFLVMLMSRSGTEDL
jgi:hypothetical protein